jgi:membrane protease YdiL (CAAX protease family)
VIARFSSADWRPLHGIFFVALLSLTMQMPQFRIWPLLWVIPLLAYLAMVATIPPLRASFSRWRFGRITPFAVSAAVIIGLSTIATLVVFHRTVHPDVSGYRTMLPVKWFGGIVGTAILFPLLNAALEEIVFRGVLFDSIASQWGSSIAVIVTAVFFGYGHMKGFPPGPIGAVLAGVFGVAIGWLRVTTGGIGLPFLTHVAADTTIFILLMRSGVW